MSGRLYKTREKPTEKVMRKAEEVANNLLERIEKIIEEQAEEVRKKARENGEDLEQVERQIEMTNEQMRNDLIALATQNFPALLKTKAEEKKNKQNLFEQKSK